MVTNLPNTWQTVEFGSVLDGGTRNGIYKKKEFRGSGLKMVNMGELFAYPRLRDVPMSRIQLTEDEIERFSLQPGDLIFARRSLTAEGAGKCSIVLEVKEPLTFESSIIRARPNKEIADSAFLYYLFNSPVGSYLLDTILRQVAVAGITGSDLVKLEIPFPPLLEQRAIAGILGALDDKIDLNRRMNRTLESMARAVFRQLFVENEDLGDWEVGTVGDVVKRISVGKKYDFKTALAEGRVPILDQAHFSTIGYHNDEPGVIASIDDPVVVFSNHRCYTDIIQYPFSAIQNVLPFVGDGVDTRWLYHATDGIITYSEYKGHYPEFISKPLVIPPEKLTKKFGEFVKPLHIKIMKNKEEARTLARLRDTLLPKLMKGEVRVQDS